MKVLQPLEFSDCLSDSPWFRQNLHEHESVLEDTYKNLKAIELQCRELVQCTKKLSAAHRTFAKLLKDFKFSVVGNNQTDDERKISECLLKFAEYVGQMEDHREKIIENSEIHYIDPLKKFRVEVVGRVLHDDKKRYEKESNKFNVSLEKHLHLSTMRKNDFKEADAQLDIQQRNFWKCSVDYVTSIQSVQERLKFEFVEILSSFLYSWLTFYHIGHVTHEDFKPLLSEVQSKVQKAKQSYEETKEHYEHLREKMLATHLKSMVLQARPCKPSQDGVAANMPTSVKQSYLFVQEKSKLPKTIGRDVLSSRWTKYYCVYQKETRIFTMIPANISTRTDMRGTLEQSVSFKVKSCTRRASDSIDKRFCFDITAVDRTECLTVQALSEEDRKQWLDAMDGREPIYSPGGCQSKTNYEIILDDIGFEFIGNCLEAIEFKGIAEQGLYRNCGVSSKVQKLLHTYMDARKNHNRKVNLFDESEWEIKTISSAVKMFLRNLSEPIMTFELHNNFIAAAKMDSVQRISYIHYYVYQLPQLHFEMLKIIITHLKKVADRSSENLMTIGNLGVCFGPTLLRPKEETMATIMDIKFFNVVVEVLISNCDQIFKTKPNSIDIVLIPKSMRECESSIEYSLLTASASLVKRTSTKLAELDTRSDREMPSYAIPELKALSCSSTSKEIPLSPKPSHIYDRVAESLLSGNGLHSSPFKAKPRSLLRSTPPYTQAVPVPSDSDYSILTKTSPIHSFHVSPLCLKDSRGRLREIQSDICHKENTHSIKSQASGSDGSLSSDGRICAIHFEESIALTKMPQLSRFATSHTTVSLQRRRVKTLFACAAEHESELSFQPGQIITNVFASKEEGWLVGTLNGKTGLIPANFVESLP